MLKEAFKEFVAKYTNDANLINELWTEIENNYSNPKRHYHNLTHLDNLLQQLTEIKSELQNWDTILFTLYYHDIIYDPQNSRNEEESAKVAEKRMEQIGVSKESIQLCKQQILATKSHVKSTDSDTNYFTDADLSILGQSWEVYSVYFKNVREEYAVYPDSIYIPGRKKVLHHFLAMNRIFKTDFFYRKLEDQAKQNLTHELQLL